MSADFYLSLVRCEDAPAVAAALGEGLKKLNYQPYDPFPGGSGPAALWKETVRAFVAPPREGWTRALGQVRPEALAHASAALGAPVLHLWLTRQFWGYLLFVDGDDVQEVEALAGLLKSGRSLDDLGRAMGGDLDGLPLDPIDASADDDALPDDVRRLAEARGVDMDRAQRMIDRWTDRLFARLDAHSGGEASAMREQAGQALAPAASVWDSPSGRRLRAFTACLALPANWHRPPLDDVRQAYIVARQKAHAPGAPLLPGDAAALARAPDAAAYLPVYFGKMNP